MKLPMNRKMIGSANGASALRAGATWRITASTGPRSAVTAIGSASVIQRTPISASTAARRCAAGTSGSGATSITANTTGASTSPAVRRRRLNNSSLGE
jgi:hypothetical protein